MRSVEEVYQLLQLLETRTAEELEGEALELKPWEPDSRRRLRIRREYVVCLANGRGGTIVLGVGERTRGITQAIGGIGEYDATSLRRGIYDGTDPHVLVELPELPIAGKSVLLVHVPRGIPPHTTSEGLAKIRVGKDCQPLTGQMLVRLLASGGQRDPTAEPVPGVGRDDLGPRGIDGLRAVAGRERGSPTLSKLDDRGLLEALGLVAGGEVTLAALLLLGRAEVLARRVPQHEVSFLRYRTATRYDQRHDLRAPLLGFSAPPRTSCHFTTGYELSRKPGSGSSNFPISRGRWRVRRCSTPSPIGTTSCGRVCTLAGIAIGSRSRARVGSSVGSHRPTSFDIRRCIGTNCWRGRFRPSGWGTGWAWAWIVSTKDCCAWARTFPDTWPTRPASSSSFPWRPTSDSPCS